MRFATLAAAALISATPLSAQTLVQDGSFADGSALLGSGTRFIANDMVVDAKDRAVVAFGQDASGRVFPSIQRLALDGSAETTYDNLPGSNYYSVRLLSLDDDDSLLAFGSRAPSGDLTAPPVGYAVRYTDGGGLDGTFAARDIDGTAKALDAVETPDGFVFSVRTPDGFCELVALTDIGDRDAGFASVPLYGGTPCVGAYLALDADGGVVVASSVTRGDATDLEITRVAFDGTLDTSFGTDGVARVDFEEGEEAIGTLSRLDDGRLLVAANAQKGSAEGKLVVILNADGHPDFGFGAEGLVFLAGNQSNANSFAGPAQAFSDGTGRVTVFGTEGRIGSGVDPTSTAARLLPDGNLDTSFGDAGYDRFRDINVDSNGPYAQNQIVADSEGRVLLSYTAGRINTRQVRVSRYLDSGTVTGEASPSAAFALRAFPNPAAGRATLAVTLDAPTALTATVHDALGRTVATLADGEFGAGRHNLAVDASRLAPGIYVVRVMADGVSQTKRLSVVR